MGKDQILTGCIMDSLDSTKGQDYVYCISVQGHGDYPTTQIIENPEITVEGIEDEALKNKYTYYVNHGLSDGSICRETGQSITTAWRTNDSLYVWRSSSKFGDRR